MDTSVKNCITDSGKVISSLTNRVGEIKYAAELIVSAVKKGNKILVCGNGGSASQASHMAGELVGRFEKERKGIPCIALTTDSSIITAWSNDYDFESIFERQVESLGSKGDILLGMSTSGNSKNVIKAFVKAREKDIKTIALTGKNGGKTKELELADCNIIVPHDNTARIQEAHLLIVHILCKLVEDLFVKDE